MPEINRRLDDISSAKGQCLAAVRYMSFETLFFYLSGTSINEDADVDVDEHGHGRLPLHPRVALLTWIGTAAFGCYFRFAWTMWEEV